MTVLIIDDYLPTLDSVSTLLESSGYSVLTASDGPSGLELARLNRIDLVLLDVKMPGMDGFEVIDRLKRDRPDLPVIIISAHDAPSTALRSAGLGAFEFLEKPLDSDKLLASLKTALDKKRPQADQKKPRNQVEGTFDIIGVSKPVQQIRELIYRVAKTEARVLITGENGTGKELVARAIHRHSHRNQAPLVEINCAAIPQELIESELFGHEKGSFTGASQQRIGKFELANGGTLFLDEIGDMSLPAQAKVLRALQNNIIQRVGGTDNIQVDVRVIAATNKKLSEEIEAGRFREDLFHRLNVIPIVVPPLRERRDDIPILLRHFIREIASRQSLPVQDISQEALDLLQWLEWKGNVRELQNMAERLVIMSHGPVIGETDVQLFVPRDTVRSSPLSNDLFDQTDNFQDFKDLSEKLFISRKLEKFGWNISKTAEALDIQRSHLYNKIEKYKIRRTSGAGE
ncbi:MAG: sigma-54-dependent Fis family transcriptional regulator [Bacteroidetes bacterium]|nr:sigma-54-dependent Fis family transcriptional regulator [Bacteroidota bacterium]